MGSEDQGNSVYRGPVEQCVQRTRGTVGTEDQLNSGTEDKRNSRLRGTEE